MADLGAASSGSRPYPKALGRRAAVTVAAVTVAAVTVAAAPGGGGGGGCRTGPTCRPGRRTRGTEGPFALSPLSLPFLVGDFLPCRCLT